ncbi:MAG: UDP-N-acetylglucosamine 2-epimerase [Planctomycetota bacterium]
MSADDSKCIVVVTGSRAEFGLLRPVIRAMESRSELDVRVVVTGLHCLASINTRQEVERDVAIAASFPMQIEGESGRLADVQALARGIDGMATVLRELQPDLVMVLGDRIEALAGATAASIGGVHVAHLHGGDRAEGVADDSVRHAISKLAHLHFAASNESYDRLIAMGEHERTVVKAGSPALEELHDMPALDDATWRDVGAPDIVLLLHPVGDDDDHEHARAALILESCREHGTTIVLAPNRDPGHAGIQRAYADANVDVIEHLPRATFIGVLRRARMLVGNSSAGIIEASALPIRVINIGSRQEGRERHANITDVRDVSAMTISAALKAAMSAPANAVESPFFEGHAGERIAATLATLSMSDIPIRKRNRY